MHIDLLSVLLHVPFGSTCQRSGMFLPGATWFLLNGYLLNMFKMVHMMRGKLYSNFCVIGGCNVTEICAMSSCLIVNIVLRSMFEN